MAPGLLAEPASPLSLDSKQRSPYPEQSSESKLGYWNAHPEPALLHRSTRERPLLVKGSSRHLLYLEDGTPILDGCGGAAVSILGNGHPEIVDAITKQASQLAYVHTLSYTTPAAEDLAEILVGDRPGGLSRAYLVGSGSEANDGAMKLARQYFYEKGEKQRTHFIARRQGYHGNCFGSMSISNNLSRLAPYHDILLPNVSHVSPCFPYRYQRASEDTNAYVRRLAEELENEFQRIGPSKVIAFFAETVGGATSGCVVPAPGYFEAMSKVCKRHGALLILDEIMCGLGRTGYRFAWEAEGIVPDIVTVGKALGAGYAPVSAILIHQHIVETLKAGSGAFNHGQTFQAHALSCAAALAVQKVVKRDNLFKRSALMGNRLGLLLHQYFDDAIHVGDIRGRGLFWALEFVQDRASKKSFNARLKFGYRVQARALSQGVAIYPGSGTIDGINGDHVLIAPAFTILEDELELIVLTLFQAYTDVLTEVTQMPEAS